MPLYNEANFRLHPSIFRHININLEMHRHNFLSMAVLHEWTDPFIPENF